MAEGEPGKKRVRLFTVALDTFPAFRVDITELFDKALAARGYDIDWAMRRAEPGPGGIVDLSGGRLCVVGENAAAGGLRGVVAKVRSWAAFTGRIARQIRAGRYDIVQVRDMPLFAVAILVLARLAKARFTYWMSYPMAESRRFRADDPQEALSPLKRRALRVFGAILVFVQYKIVLPRADHIFVQSDRMRRDVAARGVPFHKMTAVPMGVLPDSLPPEPEEAGAPFAGRPAIVHLGTLIRVRRPEFLIDVLARVRARVPEALLVFIGDAPASDMAFLRAYADRAGEGAHVRFLGAMARAQALALTRQAAVCVSPFPPHPLNDSTSPTKLVEYLALGRPAVVNDHPDQSAVIRESGAGLAVPYDADAFADALVRLLRHPQEAEAMGARGPHYVAARRSYPVLAARVDAAYRAVLA